jgi:HK97 gp10 family phage protein
MGKFDFQISPEFLEQLGKLSDVDRVAPIMLNEATPILRKNLQTKVENDYSRSGRRIAYIKKEGLFGVKTGEYTQTGAMRSGIRMSRSRKIKNGGFYAKVYFSGYDEKGVSNAEKAVYAEYGTSKQPARPFITKVVNDSTPDVLEKMQDVFNREMG